MKLRLLVPIVLLAAALCVAPVGAPVSATGAAAAPPTTSVGQFKVFNVSLKLVKCTKFSNCTGQWKTFFQRLADKDYRPDILNVLEIPFTKKDRVLNQLAAATETDVSRWGEVHSDKGTPCTNPDDPDNDVNIMNCGNNLVVWHYDKFAKLDPHRLPRTERISDNDGKRCVDGGLKNSRDVAVELQEKDELGNPVPGRTVVSAAVHYPGDLAGWCLVKALNRTEDDLAGKYGSRPMTLISGDYNQGALMTADKHAQRRREICLSDWYRSWSIPVSTSGDCSPDPGTDFGGEYLDTVRWKHFDGDTAICQEWTFSNLKAESNPGTCGSNKNRIDYIWVRREDASGSPITDAEAVGTTVLSAETDRGYYRDWSWSTRYSDHRALDALLAF